MTSQPPLRDPVTVEIERADLPLLAAALNRFGTAHTVAAEQGAKEVEANRKPGEDVRPAATRIMQLLAVAGTLHAYGKRFAELAAGIPLPAAHRHLQVAPEPAGDSAPDAGGQQQPLIGEAYTPQVPPPSNVPVMPLRPSVPADQLTADERIQQTVAELAHARAAGVALPPTSTGDADGTQS